MVGVDLAVDPRDAALEHAAGEGREGALARVGNACEHRLTEEAGTNGDTVEAADELTAYVERWMKYDIPIQFRYDYTETTPENLYEEENDKILCDLKKQFTYMGLDGCRMRNGFHFAYKGMHMTYHKTLPYSTIVETDENGVTYDILYDILIKQNGDIHSDWTGVKLDVEKYRKVVFEPYDLRVLDGTTDF